MTDKPNQGGGESKPAPTGNPGTRDGNSGGTERPRPTPTGNRGTFGRGGKRRTK
jgi:hypothetical protein